MREVGIHVKLENPDAFLKVKETLSRIGVANAKEKTLYQSCHILHKRGEYFITHFKELFELDGKPSTLTEDDKNRRNLITSLLEDWGLLTVVSPETIVERAKISSVKILSYHDKSQWNLVQKYTIGTKK